MTTSNLFILFCSCGSRSQISASSSVFHFFHCYHACRPSWTPIPPNLQVRVNSSINSFLAVIVVLITVIREVNKTLWKFHYCCKVHPDFLAKTQWLFYSFPCFYVPYHQAGRLPSLFLSIDPHGIFLWVRAVGWNSQGNWPCIVCTCIEEQLETGLHWDCPSEKLQEVSGKEQSDFINTFSGIRENAFSEEWQYTGEILCPSLLHKL